MIERIVWRDSSPQYGAVDGVDLFAICPGGRFQLDWILLSKTSGRWWEIGGYTTLRSAQAAAEGHLFGALVRAAL